MLKKVNVIIKCLENNVFLKSMCFNSNYFLARELRYPILET